MTTARKICALTLALLLLAAVAAAAGCGGGEKPAKKTSPVEKKTGGVSGLSYDDSPDNPVIVYRTSQAIAPVYNPDAPKAIVFGDGTYVRKEGPYYFSAFKLDDGVEGLLDALDEAGFYELDELYESKEDLAGGITEFLTVNLLDDTYTVTVEAGANPPDEWSDIVELVQDAPATEIGEYVPDEIVLYANEADEPAGGSTGRQWPGDPGELAGASAVSDGSLTGFTLEGDSAHLAWEAIQEAFSEDEGDTTWEAGGAFYTYVYANPVFPGVDLEG